VFTEAEDDGSGSDNWSKKSCKAPVKSSPATNQHQTFYKPDALPVANQQCQNTEGKQWNNNYYLQKDFTDNNNYNTGLMAAIQQQPG